MHNVQMEKRKQALKNLVARGAPIDYEEVRAVHNYSALKRVLNHLQACSGSQNCDHITPTEKGKEPCLNGAH